MVKNIFKYKLVTVLLAGFALTQSVQAADGLVSFKEMVEKTVASNPEVQARYHRLMETGFEQEVAKSGFYPKADVVSTYRTQEDKTPGGTTSGFFGPRMNNELVLRQNLFRGLADINEVKRLDHNKKAAYYDLQSAMENTTLDFTKAYIDILRYRDLVQMAKDNYVVHKQLFGRIQERVTAGVARKVDLDQAAGRLALAEANLLVETTNLHDVNARMQRIYGELPPETLEAPTFYNAGVEASSSDALKLAYVQNPDLLAKIEAIQASKDEVKTRESRYLPQLDLEGRKNLHSTDDGRYLSSTADSLALTMNFNLFNGFADKNLIKQSAARLNTSQDLRDKACIDTRQTVVIAYNDINQLKEQINYRTTHKNSIENAREAYRKQFDIGQRTLLDLLDTENEYFQAKRTLANSEYDLQTAFARTYAGQGELLNKLGVRRADLPEYKREAYLENESVCQSVAPVQMDIDKAALVADAKPFSTGFTPAAPVAKTAAVPAATCSIPEVTNVVKDWASASRGKNPDSFLNYYSANFVPSPSLDKAAWEDQVRKRMANNNKTDLAIENIKVTCDGDKANAKFNLNTTTTTFKLKKVANTSCEVCNMKRIATKGPVKNVNKELNFERAANQWKIIKEQPI